MVRLWSERPEEVEFPLTGHDSLLQKLVVAAIPRRKVNTVVVRHLRLWATICVLFADVEGAEGAVTA